MKNPIIILVVVAVLGMGVYTLIQKSEAPESMEKVGTPVNTGDAMMKKTDDVKSSYRYVEYSKAVLDSASNTRRVLFFYASWCSTCRPADANLTENSGKIPEDVTVIRVNYNDPETDQDEKDLAKKYAIVYQHTFVQIDSMGKEITKWNGGQIQELLSNIK